MSASLAAFVPTAPAFRLDWDRLDAAYAWIRRMRNCPQDPVHHAEGNVWIHTRMVVEELVALSAWRALSERDRFVTFAAAALHDIAKPDVTVTQPDGRITSYGHSRRGSIDARVLLWRMGVPFAEREEICRIVSVHQYPFRTIDREDPLPVIYKLSHELRCDLLAIVAEADARGRRTADPAEWQKTIDYVQLFRELCAEEGCLDRPRAFASDHTRYLYFRDGGRAPDFAAFDDTRSRVTVLSGLPGSGKDTWIAANARDLPVVSLDAVREATDTDPEDNQGRVVQAAREMARTHLRGGRDFVWNATHLGAQTRAAVLGLLADYKARIRIVYLEAPEDELKARMSRAGASFPKRRLRACCSAGNRLSRRKHTRSSTWHRNQAGRSARVCRLFSFRLSSFDFPVASPAGLS